MKTPRAKTLSIAAFITATALAALMLSGPGGSAGPASEEGKAVLYVDATTGATGARTRYAEEEAPASARELYTSARIYTKRKNYDAAIIRLDKAISIDPGFAEAYYLRGRAYLGLGRNEKARADFTRTIELVPEDRRLLAGALFSRVSLLVKMGIYRESIEDLTMALEILRDQLIIYRRRADAYIGSGDDARALEDLKRALELEQKVRGQGSRQP